MKPSVRLAEPRDSDAISGLAIDTYSAAFGHTLLASDLRAHLERHLSAAAFVRILERDVVLVAELQSRLVGYVQFGTQASADAPPGERELRRLYVAAGFQNLGLGGQLMDAALGHSLLAEASTVALDVWEQNYGAQRFYRRYGFRVVGTRKFTVESGSGTTVDLVMLREQPRGLTL